MSVAARVRVQRVQRGTAGTDFNQAISVEAVGGRGGFVGDMTGLTKFVATTGKERS